LKPLKIIFLVLMILPLDLLLSRFVGAEYRYFDLFILLILYFSCHFPAVQLIYISSSIGIMKDILSGGAVGINGFTFPIVALISYFIISRIQINKWYSYYSLAFFMTLLNTTLLSILVWIFGINILHLSILELFYHGLGNGLIFTVVMKIPDIFSRKHKLTRSKHAWR